MGARRGGGARVGRRPPPPPKKKIWGYIGGLFATFSSYGGLFATFSSYGGLSATFSHFGGLFATFYIMVEAFFWACPPPPRLTKVSAGAHDYKEGSRACFREIFWCDRNLVSSGHVLLRFCLKNDKNNDKL